MSFVPVETWQEFARETIRINDLDPTYEMLYNARKDYGEAWVARYCLHMLMFYHVGEAEVAAQYEGKDFWEHVERNYDTCKRGTERRHFRGRAGLEAIAGLKPRFLTRPEAVLSAFHAPAYPTLYRGVSEGAKGFGAYFIWKWADYLSCVFDMPIDLSQAYKYMPDQPAKCAKQVWPELSLVESLDKVVQEIQQYLDPFSYSRPCGVSEAETILCMMKGYFITKSHRIGDDLMDKHKALGNSPLRKYLPPMQDLNQWSKP